jgi:hypothetical protein
MFASLAEHIAGFLPAVIVVSSARRNVSSSMAAAEVQQATPL